MGLTLNRNAQRLLGRRGFETQQAIYDFLAFSPSALRRAESLVDGEALLARLETAVREGEFITIYGDYDADGVMATFIYYSSLDRLNPGRVGWFLNDRFEDGYSITTQSMEKLFARYPETQVVLTCDNGIAAGEAALCALNRGAAVLVTDHHEQDKELPEGCLAIDEKRLLQKEKDIADGVVPEHFCGAELARRVVFDLYRRLGRFEEDRQFLTGLYAYSGFATITDSVPMNAANHCVGRLGLKIMDRGEGVWRLFIEQMSRQEDGVHWDTVGFRFGPMINAAGRVTGKADKALEVFLNYYRGDIAGSRRALLELAELNNTRKDMCERNDGIAFRMIERCGYQNDPVILIYDERFEEGINGLTASHIVERYGRPAIVLARHGAEPDMWKGSARSIEGFNIYEALMAHKDRLKAGGHPMAAGVSIKTEDLDEVRRLLNEANAGLEPQGDKIPDFRYEPRTLTADVPRAIDDMIKALEPFGPDFEEPVFALTARPNDFRTMNAADGEPRHAKFGIRELTADGLNIEAVWWNHVADAREVEEKRNGGPLFIYGKPKIHEFGDRVSVQVTIDKVRLI